MQETVVVDSPIGRVKLLFKDSALCLVEFDSKEQLSQPASKLAYVVVDQINRYFQSPDSQFQISIMQQGTDFQRRVWAALTKIPVGKVLTYGQLAKSIGSSARAVGNACRRNPTPIIVPCHRVVSASGLGGFAGETSGVLTQIKTQLLRHEGANLSGIV